MGQPYVGEIRMFGGSFAPNGWRTCDGQLLPISQYDTLFTLIGTTYGGDGQSTFALPNLQGRVPIHFGQGHVQGESSGQAAVTLAISQMPVHTHTLNAVDANGTLGAPQCHLLAQFNNGYAAPAQPTTLSPQTVSSTGGSQPHPNMQPYLTISFCIALQGIFPSRN